MHRLIDIHPNYQSDVDFNQLEREGIKGVYIKITEGADIFITTAIDTQRRARQQNLRTGFYHFLHPRPGRSGAVEAEYFWSKVKGVNAGSGTRSELMRLVLDVETTHFTGIGKKWRTRRYTRQATNRLRQLARHEPVLYTYSSFLDNWGRRLGKLPLWIANYGVEIPRLPAPFTRYVMWQFTDKGKIPGVSGNVDINKCPRLRDLILERKEY